MRVRSFRHARIALVATVVLAVLLPAVGAWAAGTFYVKGGTITGLTISGSAHKSPTGLVLTEEADGEKGAAFTTKKVLDPTKPFSAKFVTRQDSSGMPADGMVFVIQNDPRGASAMGGGGGELGYLDITPSIGIGYNLYDNAGINYFENGSVTPVDHIDYSLLGTDVFTWVSYNPTTTTLDVYINTTNTKPEFPALSRTVDLATLLGGKARVGFTGGTGGLFAKQSVKKWKLTV